MGRVLQRVTVILVRGGCREMTMMSANPILFPDDRMVRALLSGVKSQTRRVMRLEEGGHGQHVPPTGYKCPYGKPGDLLWVREAWRVSAHTRDYLTNRTRIYTEYRARNRYALVKCESKLSEWTLPDTESDALIRSAYGRGKSGRWRPCIHMPRWASRILLRVLDVRIQRLNDLSEEDARAEGCFINERNEGPCDDQALDVFKDLWGSTWADNPWVWVIQFQRQHPPPTREVPRF